MQAMKPLVLITSHLYWQPYIFNPKSVLAGSVVNLLIPFNMGTYINMSGSISGSRVGLNVGSNQCRLPLVHISFHGDLAYGLHNAKMNGRTKAHQHRTPATDTQQPATRFSFPSQNRCAVATVRNKDETQGYVQNGRKNWGETLLPLLVGIDIDFLSSCLSFACGLPTSV
jgi:hypothetical protein